MTARLLNPASAASFDILYAFLINLKLSDFSAYAAHL